MRRFGSWDARWKFDKIFQILRTTQLPRNLIFKVKFWAADHREITAALAQLQKFEKPQLLHAARAQLRHSSQLQLPRSSLRAKFDSGAPRWLAAANKCSERMFGVRVL